MWFFWQRSQFTCGFAKLQLEFIGFQNDLDSVEHWWNPKSFKFGTFVVGSSMTAKKEHMKWFLTQNTFHGILSVCLGFAFLSQKLQGDKLQLYFVISDRPKLNNCGCLRFVLGWIWGFWGIRLIGLTSLLIDVIQTLFVCQCISIEA